MIKTPTIQELESRISSFEYDDVNQWKNTFIKDGFVQIKKFLSPELLSSILEDSEQIILDKGVNKDLLVKETNNTPRRMRTVGQHNIYNKSKTIPGIYESDVFQKFLGKVFGERVFRAPWLPERYVLSNLHRDGDTHGWHWDDYSFAFVIYLKSPSIDQGGFVQTCANGTWDKKNPKITETILNAPIFTHRCDAGDAYALKASKYLHRVTPIRKGGERLIINMTWASEKDLITPMTHETNDILFNDQPGRM